MHQYIKKIDAVAGLEFGGIYVFYVFQVENRLLTDEHVVISWVASGVVSWRCSWRCCVGIK